MIKRIADQHGIAAASAWTQSVLRHQAQINMAALRSAIASKNVVNIEAVVAASKLQQTAGRALRQPFTAAAQAAGTQSAAILKSHGLAASFNAVHPNVVNFAREQAAQLVVAIPAETKQVIAEVIALGAQYGLDVAQQARAIREVVGLPPTWAAAPVNLAQEIRDGQAAAATSRRLSAVAKQQIRSRIAAGTVDDAFVASMTEQYAASLINRRALNIARTETLRASHHGLTESWKQAQDQGVLPQTARRFWIVTPDDRLSPEHARIPGMNPNGRGMDEPFQTTEGPHMFPPSRPNCRCSVGLLPNVPEGFDVTEGTEEPLRRGVPTEDLDPVPGYQGAKHPGQWRELSTLNEIAVGQPVSDLYGDPFLSAIARDQGFAGLPSVVTEAQLNRSIATGAQELYRGMRGGRVVIENFVAGPYTPGGGGTGHGIYTAAGGVEAQTYAKLYGDDVLRMAINKDARVVTYEALKVEQKRVLAQLSAELDTLAPNSLEARRLHRISFELHDPGRFAAFRGYDAFWGLESGEGYRELVVLNRTALLVQRTEGIAAITPRAAPRLPRTARRAAPIPTATPAGELPPPRVVKGIGPPTPEVHSAAVEALREIGVDPSVMQYKNLKPYRMTQGGTSRSFEVAGEYKDGKIFLNPQASASDIRFTAAHEGEHLKFDVARAYDPRVRRYIDENFAQLRTDDGVTAYSREWWNKYEADVKAYARGGRGWVDTLPINETLAEIQGNITIGEGGAFRGTEVYRKLHKLVDDAYARAQANGYTLRPGRSRGLPSTGPKNPPLRDLGKGETAEARTGNSLSNHLDERFEDNFRVVGEEAQAVDNYMSFHYNQINGALRSGDPEKYWAKVYREAEDSDTLKELVAERMQDITALDKLMARMPELGDEAVVFRAVNNVEWLMPGKGTFGVLENASQLIGAEIRDAGFVSTTTLRNQAVKWANLKDGGTLVEIRLPKNARGAWMRKVNPDAQRQAIVQKEYLLPRNARFKVVSATVEGGINSDSVLHLIVEYVP